jgi:nucleoside-diphosphate-sugar epimerase
MHLYTKCAVLILNICAGLAKRVGARVLIASTSEVYGDPEVHPQPETYWGHVNPIGKKTVTGTLLHFIFGQK